MYIVTDTVTADDSNSRNVDPSTHCHRVPAIPVILCSRPDVMELPLSAVNPLQPGAKYDISQMVTKT